MAGFNIQLPFDDSIVREFKIRTSPEKLKDVLDTLQMLHDKEFELQYQIDIVEEILVQTQTACNTVVPGVWKHSKKGTSYLVERVGRDADDLTMKVYYRDLQTGQAWDRPYHEWLEVVTIPNPAWYEDCSEMPPRPSYITKEIEVPRFYLVHSHAALDSIGK